MLALDRARAARRGALALVGAFSLLGASLCPAGATGAAGSETPPAAEDYVLHCSACHGLDGQGTPGITPSLHGVAALLDTSEGRRYLGRVPGVAQAPLSDARLARLLNWTLRRYGGRMPTPPYSAREIGSLRRHPLRDPVAARKSLAPRQP